MKHHPKTYEDIFSVDVPKSKGRLNLDVVSIEEMDLSDYVLTFKLFLNDFYTKLFDGCVKLSWLRRKFIYHGHKTVLPINKTPRLTNSAFVKVMRRNIGKDLQIITRGKFFSKVELYFNDFFPDFMEENPFINPDYYKFPYKNISIDFLMMVYQLDDRLELLAYADEKDMSYAVFMDYVINHVCCENDDLGRDRYQIRQSQDRNFPFCIRDSDKDLQTKPGKKR